MNEYKRKIFEKILWSLYERSNYKKTKGKPVWRHKKYKLLLATHNKEIPFIIHFNGELPEFFSYGKFKAGKYGFEYTEVYGNGIIKHIFVSYWEGSYKVKKINKNE
jgi:hypothetical protein